MRAGDPSNLPLNLAMVGLEIQCASMVQVMWAVQPTDSHGRSRTYLQRAYRSRPTKPWDRPNLDVPRVVINQARFHVAFEGSTNLFPLRNSLPTVESSFRTALYCDGALSQSPVEKHSLSCETSGSIHDSSSTSCTDMAAGVDASATNRMNSSA